MGRGLFITLEGIEGSGKTTQAAMLGQELGRQGYQVLLTHEPGDTAAGRAIRSIFMDAGVSLQAAAELLLVLADRVQHVAEKVRPALAGGAIVISDRYCDSTTAYQGYGRGLDLALIGQLNRFASGGLEPDLTIVLDCPVQIGLKRTRQRAGASHVSDRFEGETIAFHERVREGFRALVGEQKLRMTMIDSSQPAEEVRAAVESLVMDLVASRCR